ncbi:MAG: hypothetical protein JHC93_06175 [Parachlamydiales bacterium]|nr:hypothetical protein [Parachlamydiales bacterium]
MTNPVPNNSPILNRNVQPEDTLSTPQGNLQGRVITVAVDKDHMILNTDRLLSITGVVMGIILAGVGLNDSEPGYILVGLMLAVVGFTGISTTVFRETLNS